MRRLLAGSAILMAGLVAPATAGAAGAPITNIAPASGSTISVSAGSTIRVEYSCPPYSTSYGGSRFNGEGYFAEFASSPQVNVLNEFPEYNLLDVGRGVPTVANPGVCETTFPSEFASLGSTVYWRATRINCEIESCIEASPIWTFAENAAAPVLPAPTPAPTPTTPTTTTVPSGGSGEGHVTVYLGCGLSRTTRSSTSCGKNEPIGAFFKDSKEATYTVCVHFPGGTKSCAHSQHAEAGTVYVNAIKRHSAGRYAVVWTVGARRFEKVISRRAR